MKRHLLIALLGAFALVASAADTAGLSQTETVQGHSLVLNGVGTRKATFLKVKVYNAGLYLESKSDDAQAILGSKQVKKINMHFVHDVSASKLKDAWQEGIEKNCHADCDALKPALAQLNSYMTDIKSGDEMSFVFFPDKVEASIKGKVAGTVPGAAFSRTMLAIWLGAEPPNESLKTGMLGKE